MNQQPKEGQPQGEVAIESMVQRCLKASCKSLPRIVDFHLEPTYIWYHHRWFGKKRLYMKDIVSIAKIDEQRHLEITYVSKHRLIIMFKHPDHLQQMYDVVQSLMLQQQPGE